MNSSVRAPAMLLILASVALGALRGANEAQAQLPSAPPTPNVPAATPMTLRPPTVNPTGQPAVAPSSVSGASAPGQPPAPARLFPPTSPAGSEPGQPAVQASSPGSPQMPVLPPPTSAMPTFSIPVDLLSSETDLLKIRDPFKRPEPEKKSEIAKTELEQVPVENLLLTGVLTGLPKIKAMVKVPNGKTYYIAENQKIGILQGYVKKITPTGVIVRQKIVNILGKEEGSDFELKVAADEEKNKKLPKLGESNGW